MVLPGWRSGPPPSVWRFATTERHPTGVATARGVVYETTSDDNGFSGGAYALDAATSKVLWHVRSSCTLSNPGCVLTNPIVANGILYAGSALPAIPGPEAQPTVANGVVYIADQDGTLYALGASTGDKLASIQVGSPIEVSNAVVVNGIVYIGGFDQHLHAYALP